MPNRDIDSFGPNYGNNRIYPTPNQNFWNTNNDQSNPGLGSPSTSPSGGGNWWTGGSGAQTVGQEVNPLTQMTNPNYMDQQSYGPWAGRADDLYNTLMQRAQQSLNINPKDEIIRNQVDAYGANEERGRRNYLNEVAEQAGPVSNTSAERRRSAEKVSQDTAAFQGQLMGRELEARRNEIAQALFMEGSLLTDEQRMGLQRQLALLENALGRDTLSERSREFDVNSQFNLLG